MVVSLLNEISFIVILFSDIWVVFRFTATTNVATTKAASIEDVTLEPVQEGLVEESEMALESPFEVQEVVVVVTSPSPPASPGYSNIFAFTADDAVD